MNFNEFYEKCHKQGLVLNDKQINQFKTYLSLLQEWNEKMNLTAISEESEVIEKHFYDSLIPSFSHKIDGTFCDVGSGAGFPSIPLKIAYPDLCVTILEPLNKRCTFLKEVVNKLELSDVNILNERAEDYAKENRESFDIVSARAVANLRILAELCIPLVKVKGLFIAMKGAMGDEENTEATKAIETLGAHLLEKQVIKLSDEANRINLFYIKEKPTPLKYPRQYGKIKKSPL